MIIFYIMKKVFWETSYEKSLESTFGKPSVEVVEFSKHLKPQSNILDLGCGDGRLSVFLASLGHHVDAVDISENGLNKLKRISSEYSINTFHCDVTEFETKKVYDMVIAHGLLQFIESKKRDELIDKMKAWTKEDGYNIVAVFTDVLPLPEDLSPYLVGVFKEDEIRSFYTGWEELYYKSYTFNDEHEGGLKHTHAVNKGVYRK